MRSATRPSRRQRQCVASAGGTAPAGTAGAAAFPFLAMSELARVNVLGVGVTPLDLPRAVDEIDRWIASGARSYVNVCTVHTVMECRRAPRLRRVVNAGGMATTDGMPLVWLSRLAGHRGARRVYGPDLMLAVCERGLARGTRHFLYGATEDVLADLAANLERRFPGIALVGRHAPPFRPPDAPEDPEVLAAIDAARPDVVWVGLGTPKQDYWVARHRTALRHPAALVAVGAAFDFHAGRLPQAPRWMQAAGLEWLFRLAAEPRRLAYRYLVYNPLFVLLVALQKLGIRRYPFEREAANESTARR